jgi:alkylation response protein AidB-like acyl-CoA dehydrogenase
MSIDTLPTSDQLAIVGSVEQMLEDLFPVSRLNHGANTGTLDAGEWMRIAENGWIGLSLPESVGGVGLELTDAVLVHRALGRSLVTPTIAATVVAARLAITAGDDAMAARLCSGEVRAAFAVPCFADKPDGTHYLIDPPAAEIFVSLAPGSARLLEIDLTDARPVKSLDPTIELWRGQPLGQRGAANRIAGLLSQALIASEMAGVATEALDRAVKYAKVREQFGKPIGAFQAVAHMCADAAMRAEAATALSNFAAIAIRDGAADADLQATDACLIASGACVDNASANVQVHGGMGFAAESDAHLYLKRAVLLRSLARAV